MGTPNSHDSTTAKMAIWAEMGPRRRIIWLMGSLVQNEYPISPRNTWPIQDRYCCHRGLSSPRLARTSANSSSDRM